MSDHALFQDEEDLPAKVLQFSEFIRREIEEICDGRIVSGERGIERLWRRVSAWNVE